MSFGFSATDFVKAIELVVQLSDALRASGDARSKFRDLIAELYALETALLQIKRLELPEELEYRKHALCSSALQCQTTIDEFWCKVKHLQPHMQAAGTGSRVKDKFAQLKWAMCKSSDVDQFRAAIRGHVGSIDILLSAIQLDVLQLESKRRDEQQQGLASMIQRFSCQVLAKLDFVSRSAAETVQHGKTLLDTSTQVLRSNVQIFAMVYDIHLHLRRVPGHVQQQQFLLTDPFNRIRPIDMNTIISEDAFKYVMGSIFKEMGAATDKLDRGDYVIEEAGTGTAVDTAVAWSSRFAPGQNVLMSMVFKQKKSETSSCPRCGTEQQGPQGQEVTCTKCQMVYRRIEELDEQETSGMYSYAMDNEDAVAADSSGGRRTLSASTREETIESSKYRRIRIIEVRSVVNGKDTLKGTIVDWLPETEVVPSPQPWEGILRKPTEKFAEHPDAIREGVTRPPYVHSCTFEGCTKMFAARKDVQKHLLTHQDKSNAKMFQCTFRVSNDVGSKMCGRLIQLRRDNARRHVIRHQKGMQSAVADQFLRKVKVILGCDPQPDHDD